MNNTAHPPGRHPWLLVAALSLLCAVASAQVNSIPLSSLPQNAKLMIWGDSITEVSDYPRYVEAYLAACAGRKDIKVFTTGHSGAELGELLSREIDLQAFNPTIVMFNYGMNDSQYTAYTTAKGTAFDQTMQQSIAMLEGKWITPIVAGPPNVSPAYSTDPSVTAAQNYCLGEFSGIGHTDASNAGAYDSDIFDLMQNVCTATIAAYGTTYGYDVHSGPNGSILMAYEDLKSLSCSGSIGAINVDMNGGATASAGHTIVSASNGVVVIDSSQYPFCYNYDPNNETGFESLDSILPYVPFSQDLNRLILTATNLGASSASVTWGGQTMTFTSAQLAAGVNLAQAFTTTPFDATFAQVMAEIVNKENFEDYEIKGTSNYFGNDNGGNVDANMIAVQAQFDAAVKAMIVPVRHVIIIVPAGSPGPAAPIITGTMMAYPTVGNSFSYQISTFTPATHFTAGNLPAWLTLNGTTGLLSGTPSATGTNVVTLSAANASGTSTTTLTLTTANAVNPYAFPYISSTATALATVGVPFSYQITASNNPTNFFVTVQSSQGTEPPQTSLPPGLTYNTSTGLFYGTPTATGTYANSVNLAALNSTGVSAQLITLIISGSGGGGLPGVPSGLMASPGNAQVGLSWTAASGATSYNIYRGTSTGAESGTAIATNVTSTTYSDNGAVNGTTYYYEVSAVNASGTSGLSNEASATPSSNAVPAPPANLTAVAGNMQVSLSWVASTGAASYNLYRGTLSGAESASPVATGITGTTYTDLNLPNGPTQYYKVAAVNTSGTSGYSNEAIASPASGSGSGTAVISVQFNSNSITSGSLTAGVIPESVWSGDQTAASYFNTETTGINNLKDSNNSINTGLDETKTDYGTYGPESASTGFANAGDNALFSHGVFAYSGSTGFTLNLAGLPTTDTYDLILYTYSVQGTYAASQVTAATPGGTTFYYTTSYASQSGYVQASSTTSASYPVANYVEWTGLAAQNGSLTATLNAPSGMTINGFQLVIHSGSGGAPATPTGLAATSGTGIGQIALGWTASTGAQSYLVQRSTNSGSGYAGIATVAAPAVAYTDSSSALVAGQSYYYEIAAANASGTSAFSTSVMAKPYVPSTFAGWAYSYFGLNAPTSEAGDASSPANDGLPNLLKYAMGLDPLTPSALQLGVSKSGSTWQLTYQRPANRPDVTYTPQVSPSLASGSWTGNGVVLSETGTGDPQTWQASYATGTNSRCFFRLQVTGP